MPGCKVASVDINQDFRTVKYTCEECNGQFLNLIDMGKYGSVSLKDKVKRHDEYTSMPLTAGPGMKCVSNDNVTLLGNVEGNSIPKCEYFKEILDRVVGCFKCEHGYGGKIT